MQTLQVIILMEVQAEVGMDMLDLDVQQTQDFNLHLKLAV
jgi:hypothetical protein